MFAREISWLLKRLLLSLFATIAALGMGEFALRLFLPAPNVFRFPQETYEFDPEIGHRLTPKQRTFTHDKEVTTNSAGIRDLEYSDNPPPNVRRIVALGDSQTFGNGLECSDTWPKQLQTALNRRGMGAWEVLNTGLPSTDTWQHRVLLGRMIRRYHPHAVILAFYVNDVQGEPNRVTTIPVTNTNVKRIGYVLKRSALLSSGRAAVTSLQNRYRLQFAHCRTRQTTGHSSARHARS